NGCICWGTELRICNHGKIATIQDKFQQNQCDTEKVFCWFCLYLRIISTKRISTNNITLKLCKNSYHTNSGQSSFAPSIFLM
ncbi:hypothetical protein, partial [Bacillus toyonensis]|uniref:hypothetical protein n=1 Tax=Bacillus toyonensis TaxID=155322 RepID=UPI001C3F22E7